MKMRKLVALATALFVVTPAFAQSSTSVRGYYRKDGTYVQPHRRTTPDSSRTNNWSTRGNINPYTGRAGTQDPYAATTRSRSSNSYGSSYDSGLYSEEDPE